MASHLAEARAVREAEFVKDLHLHAQEKCRKVAHHCPTLPWYGMQKSTSAAGLLEGSPFPNGQQTEPMVCRVDEVATLGVFNMGTRPCVIAYSLASCCVIDARRIFGRAWPAGLLVLASPEVRAKGNSVTLKSSSEVVIRLACKWPCFSLQGNIFSDTGALCFVCILPSPS